MKKILFLMTAVLVIAGCSKSEDGKLTLSANQVSLYSGDTKQVTVNDNATWSSKSEFVAEVSEDGIIKGNHVGKTIITATSDNGEALCEVVLNIALTQNLYWNLVWIRQLLRLKRNVLFWRIKQVHWDTEARIVL